MDESVEPATESLEQIKHDMLEETNRETIIVDASKGEPTILDDLPVSAPPSATQADAKTHEDPTPSPLPALNDATNPSPPNPSTPYNDTPNRSYTRAPHPQAPAFAFWAGTYSSTWTLYKAYWHDLFSERSVVLKKIDVTHAALEGAAAGAAVMGFVFLALFPRGGG